MDPADRDPAPVSDQDRLTGWKEIGAYLDKGVRTVQRWEKEYHLPIRRLGRQGGEIVWASRRELDEWLRTQGPEVRAADADQGTAPAANDDASAVASLPSDRSPALPPQSVASPVRRLRPAPWTAYGVGALAILWGSVWLFRTAPHPVSWEVKAGQFTVFDRGGQPIFARAFPYIPDGSYASDARGLAGSRVAFADLDGDGSNEILFGATAGTFPPGMGVFAFDADGTERFVYRPTHQVTFGSGTYAGPWAPYHMFVIGEGDALAIFVVFIGSLNYPTLLVELDSRGRVRSEYWSNGYIESVVSARWHGQQALFVGATNNDTHGASLAIFAEGHATGSAPSSQQEYRCLSCGPGYPTEFLVFPRRALAKAYPGREGQACIDEIRLEQDGKIRVSVAEGDRKADGSFTSTVWYTVDASLKPIEAMLTAGLFAEHAKWFAAGQVGHAFADADKGALFPVRRWVNGAFVDLPRGQIVP